VINFTPRAARQVQDLRRHYELRNRPEAIRNLISALDSAWQTITTTPTAGLPTPRPYPNLAPPGRFWLKSGRYWVAYAVRPRPVIVAVFYDMADIPNRL